MVLQHILLQAINQVAWRDFRAPSLRIVGEQLTFVSLLLVLPLLPAVFWQGLILAGGLSISSPMAKHLAELRRGSLVLGHAEHPAGSGPDLDRWGIWGIGKRG